MGWMSAFSEIGDLVGEGVDAVEGWFSGGNGDVVPATPGMKGQDISAAAGGGSWWEKGIEKAMPSIMGAAMRPKGQGHSPVAPSGHGVTANAATAMQPFQEVTKLADDNPLAGIHQWSNLFQ